MMGYIFVIDFGRYINVNINHYRHGQTLTNLTGTNPIIAFFLGRREYAKVLALIWLEYKNSSIYNITNILIKKIGTFKFWCTHVLTCSYFDSQPIEVIKREC